MNKEEMNDMILIDEILAKHNLNNNQRSEVMSIIMSYIWRKNEDAKLQGRKEDSGSVPLYVRPIDRP